MKATVHHLPNPMMGKRMLPAVFIGLVAVHLIALCALVPAFFAWRSVVVAIVLWYVTGGLGITLCFHRILTHRSLRLPRFLEYFAALIGTLAMQGGPIDWVATHRKHHAYSDSDGDPHDIHRGLRWAHMDWLYAGSKDRLEAHEATRWAKDLMADPFYRFLQQYVVQLQVVFGLILWAIGGWSMVIWGIFARLVWTYHCTWLVNSAAHAFGYQTFRSGDRSRNNWWVALLSFGEGWHNNHHAFPFSARHGLRWYEFDLTWMMIRLLSILGLASKVKVPTQEMMERLKLDKKKAA